MNLSVEIPDDVAVRLRASGGSDLARRAREAFLAEEYQRERADEVRVATVAWP